MNMYILCLWICNRIFLFFSICIYPYVNLQSTTGRFTPKKTRNASYGGVAQVELCGTGHSTWVNDANLQRVVVNLFGGMGFLVFLEGMAALGTVWYRWLLHPREHNIIFKITLVRVVLVRPRAEKVVVSLNPTGWGFFLAHVKSFVVESFYTLSTNSQWYEGEKL